jgi:hypothetical protein
MRRAWLGLLVLLLLSGCLWDRLSRKPVNQPGADPFRALGGPAGSDVVAIEVAVLEANIGDKFFNDGVWNTAIEQSLAPETRKMLEENGMRAGWIAGQPPDFLQIMTSDKTNPNPRRLTRRLGDAAILSLGAVRPQSQFQLVNDGKLESITLPQAQCLLQIQPLLNGDHKFQLQFTPQMQHGESNPWSHLGSVVGVTKPPVDTYSALRWEMALDVNEYLIIGPRLDRPKSLGCQFFVTTEGDQPVQRMLAIRAGQLPAGRAQEANPSSPTAPLAYQAARGTSR